LAQNVSDATCSHSAGSQISYVNESEQWIPAFYKHALGTTQLTARVEEVCVWCTIRDLTWLLSFNCIRRLVFFRHEEYIDLPKAVYSVSTYNMDWLGTQCTLKSKSFWTLCSRKLAICEGLFHYLFPTWLKFWSVKINRYQRSVQLRICCHLVSKTKLISLTTSFFYGSTAPSGPKTLYLWGLEITASHSIGFLWTSDRPVGDASTWQHTTLTGDRYPCPRRDSNSQCQQASDRRPTP